MLKALWYLVKLSLFIALAVWLAMQPGAVSLSWAEYDIAMPTGTLAVLILVLIVIVIVLSKIVTSFFRIPGHVQHWREKAVQESGYRSLSKGFAALSAGDTNEAKKMGRAAAKSLGYEDGVIALLEAMAARVAGDDERASERFKILMADKDTSFLGVKGLMLMAQEQDNVEDKLTLARVAYKLHPTQAWVMENLYKAEIESGDWRAAEDTLNKGIRKRIFDKEKVFRDKIAIRLALSAQKLGEGATAKAKKFALEAYKLDPTYVPSVLAYCEFMADKNSIKAIEKAWKENPHPQLLDLWKKLEPANKAKATKWFERLAEINPADGLAHTAAAEKAISLEMYGLARNYLRQAEKHGASKYFYQTYAKLEEAENNNSEAARVWLDKIETLPDEKTWICTQEAIIYEQWSPVAKPHGAFNTIEWQQPSFVRKYMTHPAKAQNNILLPTSKSA